MTPDAVWLARHVRWLRASYRHWTGDDLLPPHLDDAQAVAALEAAQFAVVSHGTQPDPIFNYANPAALALFEMSWLEFTALPSRLSAEPMLQSARDQLLARAAFHGCISDYSGVRISKTGRRFLIRNATVWDLRDDSGQACGQAALLREWQPLA